LIACRMLSRCDCGVRALVGQPRATQRLARVVPTPVEQHLRVGVTKRKRARVGTSTVAGCGPITPTMCGRWILPSTRPAAVGP